MPIDLFLKSFLLIAGLLSVVWSLSAPTILTSAVIGIVPSGSGERLT